MKNKMKWKKSPITLIELMVVMAIIALIGGVVMFNLHGSLEKSKEFISQQKMERLQQGLTLQLMEQPSLVKRLLYLLLHLFTIMLTITTRSLLDLTCLIYSMVGRRGKKSECVPVPYFHLAWPY